jgi:threonyl-tRNA synthetase
MSELRLRKHVGTSPPPQLVDPTGSVVDSRDIIEAVPTSLGRDAVAEALGRAKRLTTLGAILRQVERLGVATRCGAPEGVLVVLPRGQEMAASVERLNAVHAAQLRAASVRLPVLFDSTVSGMAELTDRFERQRRTYHLGDSDPHLRLAYAADPALFSWLRGKAARANELPWSVYTPTPVFKRFQSGELDILNQRDYILPDIHTFCTAEQALSALERNFRLAGRTARLAASQDWVVHLEISPVLADRYPDLAARVARAAESFVLVRWLTAPIGYMDLRAGLNISCGAGSVMLYNFQWDGINGRRFAIQDEEGRPLVVLHGTLLGGMSKVIPALVGRSLSGLRPLAFPFWLAPVHLYLLPVGALQNASARTIARRLCRDGVRAEVLPAESGSLRHRIAAARREWGAHYAVIGERERRDGPWVEAVSGRGRIRLEAFVRTIQRMTPPRGREVLSLEVPFG